MLTAAEPFENLSHMHLTGTQAELSVCSLRYCLQMCVYSLLPKLDFKMILYSGCTLSKNELYWSLISKRDLFSTPYTLFLPHVMRQRMSSLGYMSQWATSWFWGGIGAILRILQNLSASQPKRKVINFFCTCKLVCWRFNHSGFWYLTPEKSV